MYWSHAHADKYAEWFTSIGFTILRREYIPEHKGGHTLFWLKKELTGKSRERTET
jgi:hypothetical protein